MLDELGARLDELLGDELFGNELGGAIEELDGTLATEELVSTFNEELEASGAVVGLPTQAESTKMLELVNANLHACDIKLWIFT